MSVRLLATLCALLVLVGGCASDPAGEDLPRALRSLRDGMELVLVPAGPFWMGSDDGDEDERPMHRVILPAYYIDRRPVTNAQMEVFLNEAGYDPRRGEAWYRPGQAESGLEWSGGRWKAVPGRADHPVNGVSWYGARAYAAWAGRRLPTEAEWEKAARGTDGRRYPWGDEWRPDRSNGDGDEDGFAGLAPVGSFPGGTSPYGVEDMAGNLWEWVASRYRPYPYVAEDGREVRDPPVSMVNRGGSWRYDSHRWSNRITNRGWDPPDVTDDDYGFRCAASPPEPGDPLYEVLP